MPIPNDARQSSLSLFTDIVTLQKEERARRRVLRIQQVRQQSKLIASQAIARSKDIQRHQEHILNQQRDQQIKDWKREKIDSLKAEVRVGLENLGGSHKAVEKELEALADRNAKDLRNKDVAKERGRVASQEVLRQLQDNKLREEQAQQVREEVHVLEKIRAKTVASLPIPPSTVRIPISAVSSTNKSSVSNTDCKNKVEVYNYSDPRPSQFCNQPEKVVEKITPRTCQVDAKKQAEKELQDFIEKQCKEDRQRELTSWLGGAAKVRKTLEKQYSHLIKKLPELERKESQAKPLLVTLSDIEKEEAKQRDNLTKKSKEERTGRNKISTQLTSQTMEPNNYDTTDASVPKQDLTAFPLAQFTPEETGALGATASSLQALLGSLVDESRRRLQEVVDDDFDFNDDDFEEPNLSPPESPPPSLPPDSNNVKVDVKSTHQLSVDGSSLPQSSTVTSEVHVSVTNKSRNKRRKKKSKNKPDDNLQSSAPQEKDSKDLHSENEKDTEVKTVTTEDNRFSKTVEIDDSGVAYVRKTNVTERKVINSNLVSSADKDIPQNESLHVDTNFTERNVQSSLNNKHSFESNSTQYFNPPSNFLTDDNIDNYLRSIEMEKKQVEELIQSKKNSGVKEINLPQYINKLLTMTRDSVDQLSVSDVTESSSVLLEQKKRKKKKKKSKTLSSVSGSSSNSLDSPSTSDSHVTLSVPSPLSGTVSDPSLSSNGQFIITSSSSENSNLKFSESSSLKESSNSEIGHITKTVEAQSICLETTSYNTLAELSRHIPEAPQLVAPPYVNNSSDPVLDMANNYLNDSVDPLVRQPGLRLSTIVEADSSVIAAEECVPDGQQTNETTLDIEAELKKRGLPTLQLRTGDSADTLLSPNLDKKLKDLKVAPWSSSMMSRMKKANNNLSSSSDEAPLHCSDLNISDGRLTDRGICHSTPVSMERPATSELPHGRQSQRFFLQDSIVSPILANEETN